MYYNKSIIVPKLFYMTYIRMHLSQRSRIFYNNLYTNVYNHTLVDAVYKIRKIHINSTSVVIYAIRV